MIPFGYYKPEKDRASPVEFLLNSGRQLLVELLQVLEAH